MASLTIRNLDERVKQDLRMQAAARGISMEEQARRALAESLSRKASFENPAQKVPTADQKRKAADVMAWIRSLPKGKPLDQRYVTLDHKTVSDMISDGEL